LTLIVPILQLNKSSDLITSGLTEQPYPILQIEIFSLNIFFGIVPFTKTSNLFDLFLNMVPFSSFV